VKFESVIRRHLRRHLEDNEANVDVEARVNAALAANIGETDGVATATTVDGSGGQTTRVTRTTRRSTTGRRGR